MNNTILEEGNDFVVMPIIFNTAVYAMLLSQELIIASIPKYNPKTAVTVGNNKEKEIIIDKEGNTYSCK